MVGLDVGVNVGLIGAFVGVIEGRHVGVSDGNTLGQNGATLGDTVGFEGVTLGVIVGLLGL